MERDFSFFFLFPKMQLSPFISLVDQCTCKEKQVFFRKISEYKLQKDLLAPGCLSACVITENGWLRLHHTALRCVVLQECMLCCVVFSCIVHCNPFFCIAYSSISFIYCIHLLYICLLHICLLHIYLLQLPIVYSSVAYSSISFIYCIYLLHIYLLHCIWTATAVPQPLTRFPRAIRSLPPHG